MQSQQLNALSRNVIGAAVARKATTATEPFATEQQFDELSNRVIGAAIEVHRHLGPGLLRSAYEECLCYELSAHRLAFERSRSMAVRFRDIALPKPAELEVVVGGELPLMIVSVTEITPLLEARMLGRLRIGGWKYGLLMNFSEKKLASGIRRLVNPQWD